MQYQFYIIKVCFVGVQNQPYQFIVGQNLGPLWDGCQSFGISMPCRESIRKSIAPNHGQTKP
jgi:hypothetical protein